jgi:hypothetical protein
LEPVILLNRGRFHKDLFLESVDYSNYEFQIYDVFYFAVKELQIDDDLLIDKIHSN